VKITDEGVKLRGWEALKAKLEGKGFSNKRIEEARISFYEGIEVLSRMFLSLYQVKDMKRDNTIDKS
jgi:hypothetical protein